MQVLSCSTRWSRSCIGWVQSTINLCIAHLLSRSVYYQLIQQHKKFFSEIIFGVVIRTRGSWIQKKGCPPPNKQIVWVLRLRYLETESCFLEGLTILKWQDLQEVDGSEEQDWRSRSSLSGPGFDSRFTQKLSGETLRRNFQVANLMLLMYIADPGSKRGLMMLVKPIRY